MNVLSWRNLISKNSKNECRGADSSACEDVVYRSDTAVKQRRRRRRWRRRLSPAVSPIDLSRPVKWGRRRSSRHRYECGGWMYRRARWLAGRARR